MQFNLQPAFEPPDSVDDVDDFLVNRRHLAAYLSCLCSKCLVRRMEQVIFPAFVNELSLRWREHEQLYTRYRRGTSAEALAALLPLVETPLFRICRLPNGELAEIDFRRVRQEHVVRDSPWRVVKTHSRCRCHERRHLIDAYVAGWRQASRRTAS